MALVSVQHHIFALPKPRDSGMVNIER